MKILLLMLMMSCSLLSVQDVKSQEIAGCNRHGGIREFIQTCLFKVGGTQEERKNQTKAWKENFIKRLFSLAKKNKIIRIHGLGAQAAVYEFEYNPRAVKGETSLEDLSLLVDRDMGDISFYGISQLYSGLIKNEFFKYKYAKRTCEGYNDLGGNQFIDFSQEPDLNRVYYTQHKTRNKAYIADTFIEGWKSMQDSDDKTNPYEWTLKKVLKKMSAKDRASYEEYKDLDQMIAEGKTSLIVSTTKEGWFTAIIAECPVHGWEIIAIDTDNTECSQ